MKAFTRTFIGSAVLLAALCSTGARAQDSVEVRPGSRVRLRSDAAAPWQYGRFAGLAADSILLRPERGAAQRRIAIGTLQQVDVRQRDGARHTRNALVGALIGAAGTAVAFDIAMRRCERKNPHSDGPPCAIGWGIVPIYAMGAALIGGFAGRSLPANRWQPVILVPPR